MLADSVEPPTCRYSVTVGLERAYAISPEGEDFTVIASGLYDKVRNDPRFKAGLPRVRTQIYDRVRRARLAVTGQ
jgi:hypothetical protein